MRKINGKVIIVLTAFCFLFFNSCSSLGKLNAELLAERFRWQLKDKKFDQIYDDSADSIHRNISKQEFTNQLEMTVIEAKKIDVDMSWHENFDLIDSSGFSQFTHSKMYFVHKELSNETNKIIISIYWTDETGKPQLCGFNTLFVENS